MPPSYQVEDWNDMHSHRGGDDEASYQGVPSDKVWDDATLSSSSSFSSSYQNTHDLPDATSHHQHEDVPLNLRSTSITIPHVLPLIAKLGGLYTREKRDVYMQWLKPFGKAYAAAKRGDAKDDVVAEAALAWIARGGVFYFYASGRGRRRRGCGGDESSSCSPDPPTDDSTTSTGSYRILDISTDWEEIVQCTKLKLSKLAHKYHRSSLSTDTTTETTPPKLDMLIALLSQTSTAAA